MIKNRVTIEIKQAGPGGFEGYGSVFHKLDRHGDIVMPGAFKESLPKFLKEGFIGGVGHKHDAPSGRYVDATEDGHGLYVKAEFSDVAAAKETRTLIQDRVVQKLSVGFEPLEVETVTKGRVRDIWRQAGYTPTADDERRLARLAKVRLIHKADLLEVSPVTIASNDEARILTVKGWSDAPAEFQRFMLTARAAMLKLSTVNTKAGRVLSGKNEMKLRAMLEVLTSVSEELNNLLALVAAAPTTDDMDEQADEDADTLGDEQDEPVTADQKQQEGDEEFAKQRGSDKKAADLNFQANLLMILAESF